MPTQQEAIIDAFKVLKGPRRIKEIQMWVSAKYAKEWKDFATKMADMVPIRMGGNQSSNVPNKFRVLRKVSQGIYQLISDNPQDQAKIGKIVNFPSSNLNGLQNGPKSYYSVISTKNIVEVWSTKRLPFEPKGWVVKLRSEICSAVKKINVSPNNLFYAAYISPIKEKSDVENILFYNVGTKCFSQIKNGIRFERVFSPPPKPKPPTNIQVLHYHYYGSLKNETGFKYWTPTKTCLTWNIKINPKLFTNINSPTHVWNWMKNSSIKIINRPKTILTKFGLRIELKIPNNITSKLMSWIKPLFDGVISSFHQHDGTQQDLISVRLKNTLKINEKDVIENLNDDTSAVLGCRRLIWTWKNSVQWNPADDNCLAGELKLIKTTNNSINLSGELFEIKKNHTGL